MWTDSASIFQIYSKIKPFPTYKSLGIPKIVFEKPAEFFLLKEVLFGPTYCTCLLCLLTYYQDEEVIPQRLCGTGGTARVQGEFKNNTVIQSSASGEWFSLGSLYLVERKTIFYEKFHKMMMPPCRGFMRAFFFLLVLCCFL